MNRDFAMVLLLLGVAGCGDQGAAPVDGSPALVSTARAADPVAETLPRSESVKMSEPEKTSDTSERVVRGEAEWRRLLTSEQFRVLRQKGTERPHVNEFNRHFEPGTYSCAACGQELFASETKFPSACGWPAFYATKAEDRVRFVPDFSHGMIRTEVVCARCDSHLGHIFEDAPQMPTGQRYCINSVAMTFTPSRDEAGMPIQEASPDQD